MELTPFGISAPHDFPAASYNAAWELIGPRASSAGSEYAVPLSASFKAIAYRFLGMAECDEAFRANLKRRGSSPEFFERYEQERDLFHFFVAGLSALEAMFHTFIFAVAVLRPAAIVLDDLEVQARRNTGTTLGWFAKTGSREAELLQETWQSDEIREWRTIRNLLAHRASPGRTLFASTRRDHARSAEWKLEPHSLAINEDLTAARRLLMSQILTRLLGKLEATIKQDVE